jgi:hypothetical protein
MMVVVVMSLRRLRSRKGCETKGGGSRKSGESFGLSRQANLACCACEVAAVSLNDV